jgi:hypothetical protein
MYCLSCGSPIQVGSAFCTICGSPVSAASANFAVAATGLRPLGVGERLDASFKAYRTNFKANCLAILLIAVPVAIVEAIVTYSTKPTIHSTPFGTTGSSTDQIWTQFAGLILVYILSAILTTVASATTVLIVGARLVGETVTWRAALSRALRRTGSIFWITLLVQLGWLIPVAVVGTAGGFLVAFGPRTFGIIVLVLGSLALIPFCAWFYTNQSLAVPVLMLEDIRGVKAIRRSFQLIRNSWWSVFFTLLLAFLIVLVGGFIFGVIFVIAQLASLSNTFASVSLGAVQKVISLILFTPFTATVIAILTIDMRVRKEGLDLEVLSREMVDPSLHHSGEKDVTREGSGFPSITPSVAPGDHDGETSSPRDEG